MTEGNILKPSEQTKTFFFFSIRTKIPTLIDNMEYDGGLTISIYMVKVDKIGYQSTQENNVNVSLGSFSYGACYDST